MKLSVFLNFFDGAELLVPCLKTIRAGAEHVSVVFQEVSNFGNPVAASSRTTLHEAVSLGLVDQVLTYVPQLDLGGAWNEHQKRALGVLLAQEAGANSMLFLDVDEFYEMTPFLRAKRRIVGSRLINFRARRGRLRRVLWPRERRWGTCRIWSQPAANP